MPKLFDEQVPLRTEYVLGQGFTRDPEYCKSVLPDERMWPSELDQLPAQPNGRIRIDRAVVFAIAQRVVAELTDPRSATQLHAAIIFGELLQDSRQHARRGRCRATTPRHT